MSNVCRVEAGLKVERSVEGCHLRRTVGCGAMSIKVWAPYTMSVESYISVGLEGFVHDGTCSEMVIIRQRQYRPCRMATSDSKIRCFLGHGNEPKALQR